jgi:flagellar basal-body rod modification protein FlgD
MDAIGALTNAGAATTGSNSFSALGSQEFLQLLITQLTNQDPLEPTGNEELLRQISSIRDIELSTSMTDSLRGLTGRQSFTSASALIGQYVTSIVGSDGLAQSGLVVGVRFSDANSPILQLSSGAEVPIEQVGAVQSPRQAAEALVGQLVRGLDRRDRSEIKEMEGVVTGVQVEGASGDVMLELDTGGSLRLRDVQAVSAT